MIAKRPAPPDDDGNLPSPSANLPDPALPQSTQRSDSAEARDYIAANPLQRETSVRAWLFFIAGVCLLAALWKPISAAYSRIAFEPEIRGPRDADSFIALAYGAVSGAQKPAFEEVTREKFEMQIQALRERGFNPIGLSDVKAFYEEGQLLPRKAVLITMEQSKRVSYLETRSILRSYRWKATMFVRSDTIENKDPGALRWPILREMAQSGTWEIGAQSADGYRSIPSGPDGKKGNFFSSPMWLAAEQRLESPDEFEARIRADHDLMLKHFQDGMGQHPIAFAYPYGDYGQYDPRAVPTRLMNVTQV
nr:polysaccharide deacetylase family protein [Kiritimatiellia bacterium]